MKEPQVWKQKAPMSTVKRTVTLLWRRLNSISFLLCELVKYPTLDTQKPSKLMKTNRDEEEIKFGHTMPVFLPPFPVWCKPCLPPWLIIVFPSKFERELKRKKTKCKEIEKVKFNFH